MMHAGADVDWNTVMHATFGAHFGVPVEELLLALVVRMVRIGAGRAEVVVEIIFRMSGEPSLPTPHSWLRG